MIRWFNEGNGLGASSAQNFVMINHTCRVFAQSANLCRAEFWWAMNCTARYLVQLPYIDGCLLVWQVCDRLMDAWMFDHHSLCSAARLGCPTCQIHNFCPAIDQLNFNLFPQLLIFKKLYLFSSPSLKYCQESRKQHPEITHSQLLISEDELCFFVFTKETTL